ncbi:hypothetical protein CRUP_008810 [Coryphaenoides rupestris]|nr:hypothetical protein CRUP_008810 [Coryphaenoides rupestris]
MCRVQSQVDEVIDVMQENISKVIERGERLEDLQDKSVGKKLLFSEPAVERNSPNNRGSEQRQRTGLCVRQQQKKMKKRNSCRRRHDHGQMWSASVLLPPPPP